MSYEMEVSCIGGAETASAEEAMQTVLPITVVIAVRDEIANIDCCLAALQPAARVVVVDSHSTDGTAERSAQLGSYVVQFSYSGGFPKKRQWALDNLDIDTEWVLLLDADEVVPPHLWEEISEAVAAPDSPDAFIINKGFHFLGRKFRFGGFSHGAVLLFRRGKARFEQLVPVPGDTLDMEVHERLIVDGPIGHLKTPLIHEDFKGLEAYLARHNRYSTWEAVQRDALFATGKYGIDGIKPKFFGNTQEWRRFIKPWIIRLPCEHWIWFVYHYVLRLGFLEGRRGLIASQIRASYIRDVRAKQYELRVRRDMGAESRSS